MPLATSETPHLIDVTWGRLETHLCIAVDADARKLVFPALGVQQFLSSLPSCVSKDKGSQGKQGCHCSTVAACADTCAYLLAWGSRVLQHFMHLPIGVKLWFFARWIWD